MTEARANNPGVRVVVLSADAPVRAALSNLSRGVECVAVQSAYEAAAELVAGDANRAAAPNWAGPANGDRSHPAATGAVLALVVDLRLMSPRHLRLLQIARERDVELLAVGGIPSGLTPEDLSGVRLVARADLKAALEKLLATPSAALGAGRAAAAAEGIAEAPAISEAEPLSADERIERDIDEGRYVSDEAPPNHETQWEPEEPPRAAPSRPTAPAGASRAGGDSSRRGAAASRAAGGNGSESESKRTRERTAVSGTERPDARGSSPHTPGEPERAAVGPAASPVVPAAPKPAAAAPDAAAADSSARAGQGPAPRSILTKEELAALLEDEK
jgi:hypothetical protein